MKIKPINKNLFVEVVSEAKTNSGLLLAGSNLAYEEAKVIAVADDLKGISEGDTVMFVGVANSFEYEGKTVAFIPMESVLGVKQ